MATENSDERRLLMITADDYGYWPSYNRGILEAVEMGAVKSVNPDHRQWPRERGVPTNDALIGRDRSSDPTEPPEPRRLQPGVTEWMTHPGHADPESGSSYDMARHEDLELLQRVVVRARYDE